METIEGKQPGSILYVYNNYTYNMDNRYTYLYRCSKRKTEKCSGLLRKDGESYILERAHNHLDEPYIVQILNMRKEMVRLTLETTKPLKEIFDTVCRSNPTAAAYISYNCMKSILSRQRTKSRPPLPSNLHSLHDILQTYEPIRSIYKGCAVSTDNKIALIFSSDKLLKLLSEVHEVFVDGTFSVITFFKYLFVLLCVNL